MVRQPPLSSIDYEYKKLDYFGCPTSLGSFNTSESWASYNRIWCLKVEKKAAYLIDLLLQHFKATKMRYATMGKNNVIELERRVIGAIPLTELLKEGARKLLAQAVESEVQDLLA